MPDLFVRRGRGAGAAALAVVLALASGAAGQTPTDDLGRAVQQLRDAIGRWTVTTEFLAPDGRVARTARGTYTFAWVLEDRIVRGESTIPDLDMTSGLLFYVNPAQREIEMASVGKDGQLWVMTGPAGGETRTTPDRTLPDGSRMMLRFTRFNVAADRFESRMEVSTDGGTTWVPGNHQVFVRAGEAR